MDRKRKKKASLIGLFLSVLMIFLAGCQNRQRPEAETPEEAARLAMEALERLDFEGFNLYTDNYKCTRRNWLGIPLEREYQMFQELQQPGLFRGKRYRANRELAENIMEKLSWEIESAEAAGEEAWVTLRIANADLTDAMGCYVLKILEGMTESQGTGIGELIAAVSRVSRLETGELFGIIDELQEKETVTREVRLRAEKREGAWKLCLDEEFIHAVMGNMDSDWFSPEMEERLRQQEERYEEKMEKWGEELEERIERTFE